MMNRETVKDIISNFILFLLFLAFLVSVRLITVAELPWAYLFAMVPFFALYLTRRKVYVLPTFFVIHGLFLLLPLIFFRTAGEIIPMMLVAVLSVIYSVRVRTNKEWRPDTRLAVRMTASLAVIYFVCTLVFNVVHEDVDRFFFAVTLIALASALLVIQMDNVDSRIEYLPDRLRRATPMKNILSANNVLISGFLAFIISFGMLSLFSPNIWRVVRRGLYVAAQGVRALFLLMAAPFLLVDNEPQLPPFYLPWPDNAVFIQVEPIYEDIFAALAEERIPYAEQTMSTLFWILATILFTILGVIIFYAVRTAIRALIKHFFKGSGDDESESLLPGDAKGRLKFMLRDFTAFLPRFGANARHPIRRAFAKKVNRHIKKGANILPCDTPDAIANKIRPTENIDTLTAQYERVRYGA